MAPQNIKIGINGQVCRDGKRKNSNTEDQNGEATSKKLPIKITRKASECKSLSSNPAEIMPDDRKMFLESKGVKISEVKLVIVKAVQATDLKKNSGRFSVPYNQVKQRDFLTPEEERTLCVGNGKGKAFNPKGSGERKALEVKLIEPCLKETPMKLKVWDLKNTCSYMLTTGWNSVLVNSENASTLIAGKLVQLWSFRLNGQLYFLLNGIEDKAANGSNINNNIKIKIRTPPRKSTKSTTKVRLKKSSKKSICTVPWVSHSTTIQDKYDNQFRAVPSPVIAIDNETDPNVTIQENSDKFCAVPSPIMTIDNDSNPDVMIVNISFCDNYSTLRIIKDALRDNLGLDSSIHQDLHSKQIKLHITIAETNKKVEDPKLLDAILLTIINPLVGYPPEVVFGFVPRYRFYSDDL